MARPGGELKMEKREIRELKSLLKSYKQELSKGNKKHAKDAIAALVLLNFKGYPTVLMNVEDTTLKTLMFWGINIEKEEKKCFVDNKSNWFKVPTSEELKSLNNKYKKELKNRYYISPYTCNEKAVTTWLENMVNVGMVQEGEIINLEEYRLSDFMTDESLKSMFKRNEQSILDYSVSSKTK